MAADGFSIATRPQWQRTAAPLPDNYRIEEMRRACRRIRHLATKNSVRNDAALS